jgi:hypothetical protein
MQPEQLTQAYIDMDAKLSAYNERSLAAIARLSCLETEVKDQGKLLVVVERLANGISNLTNKVDHLDNKVGLFGERISLIELKPAKNMERIKTIVWTTVITGVLSFLITYILKANG